MKERGRYQIQLMKTRSSSGVGTKVDLEFNMESLRITDPGEEAQIENGGFGHRTGSQIMDQIKAKSSTVADDTPQPQWIKAKPKLDDSSKTHAGIDSSKLKSLLADIKSKS
jgi:hypothetical protein